MSFYGSNQALNSGRRANSRSNLAGGMTYHYARSDVAHGGGNGVEPMVEGFNRSATFSRATMKGSRMMSNTMGSATMGGMSGSMPNPPRTAQMEALCKEYLQKAEYAIQTGSPDAAEYMRMAKDAIERLKAFAMEMNQMGQPTDNVVRSVEHYQDQLRGVHMGISGTSLRRRSTRKSSGGWEEPGVSFYDAIAWIHQQKRLIETTALADDPPSIEQQLINHQRFHKSLQGSAEMIRARDDLSKSRDKANQYALEQEWENLQKMSNLWAEQLQELIQILHQITNEIIWVNSKEEEELMFDWGDKNVEQYIPKKQESYSKLMSALEVKEKELHKLKAKVKTLLNNNHPGSDKIEAYMDTLQTQWSWLLQITKCIDTHLKENAAYSQFFREASDTYKNLQKEHETIRKKFTCDKNTPLEDLQELLKGLEMEREHIMDNKRQVKHLTAMSKGIVRLKPRNPEEKNSSGIIVKALTDFREDQKAILKDNEAILKDNSQRSKWLVTGPGGIDMLVPSVCLIVPPPNPLSISLANKNEQYFDSIMSIWNQLYINVKSLISWHYCLREINYVNSLTISMLSEMHPEEYRQIMKKLESFYEEFKINSHDSEMFVDEDKKSMENQVTVAQAHYDKLVVELPTYTGHQEQIEVQQIPEQQVQPQLIIIQQQPQQHQLLLLQQQEQQRQQQVLLLQQQQEKQQQLLLLQQQQQEKQQQLLLQQQQQEKQQQLLLLQQQQQEKQKQLLLQQQQQAAAEEEARRLEEERRQAELKRQAKKEVAEKEQVIKKDVVKVAKMEQRRKVSSSSSSAFSSAPRLLSELHGLRLRMDTAEGSLSQYVHICFGDDGAKDCGLKITQLESIQDDVSSMRGEYTHLRERILKEMETTNDLDKAQFLRNEIAVMSQKLGNLESSSSAYVLRLRALRDMLESVARAEDIVKVHEARLTEKETTSLSPAEVGEYMEALKNMKAELMQKQDVLTSMESELSKASHWNSQMGSSFHRCDLMLSKFTEQVGLLSDRWRRIQKQIDTRLQDLQLYLPQLQQYKQVYTSFTEWIEATRRKQDALQATKIENVQAVKDHITNQKVLNTEIKAKRETLDSVLQNIHTCVNTIKDYETDLASYTSGLETLLNVPIKRTMLQSPSMDLNKEAIHLQTRYTELLILSGDYYKFLGQLEKNMEELKMRNTQINMLGDQLHSLREEMEARNAKNKSLEEAVAQFKLQLSQSQERLLSAEEIKQKTVMQCSATKDSLDSTQGELANLKSEVQRLEYKLDDERRKAKLAEEGYKRQKNEWESVLNQRQKELDMVCRSKKDVEDSLANKEHEIEQLRQKLANESTRLMDLQKEMSKTQTSLQSLQSKYSEIVSEKDSLSLKLQRFEFDKEQMLRLQEEVNHMKHSHELELRNKQRLQDDIERGKRDLNFWKDQCDSKQSLIRQYDTDKDILERDKKSLKSEIERLMKEHRELEEKYKSRLSVLQKQLQDGTIVRQTMETELKQTREPPIPDASSVVFDGVRKPVTAKQLLDSGVLDKPTYNQLLKGHKTVPEVSAEKKVLLKGTGPIAGVIIESPKGPGSSNKPFCKLTFTEAKKENLLPPDSIDLLLDAQAATGHIIEPRTNQKLTVKEAYNQGVIDDEDKERLLAAEAAAVGYAGPGKNKPLSVFQAMKQGVIDKNTALRLLQAQESVGGILDPILSVFLPRDIATERNLIDESMCNALNQRPELYLDPETEEGVTYMAMKRRCKIEPHTGLCLLPIPEKVDPSNLVFDGVRKPVTAKHLFDCHVLDKPTFKALENGKKTVPEVSEDKTVNLKGTGPIAGVVVSGQRKMSLTEAKKQMLLSDECADLLLEAQAATGHIIDPKANKKLTVEEAYSKGVVDINDLDRLLASEAAAIGYKDPNKPKPISVFQAVKNGLIDEKTGIRFLQAQESVGGILDTNFSVFLPRDTAIKRNLLDKNLCQALNQKPEYYVDPETEQKVSYQALKNTCKIEPHTGLLLLPIPEKLDPSKLIFDGVRKPVTAKQLFDCGVLDKPTLNQLMKGDKTVPEVSVHKQISLKGTGSIAGVTIGSLGKMNVSEAKKQMLMSPESADLLLEAQAATGHIIDPMTNQKLTVEEACARGVVDRHDQDKLLAAESAAVGFKDPHTGKSLSVFEAIKKSLIDKKTGLRLLQAQESAGGILDPNLSVFLPKDTAIKRNILDEELCHALNQKPKRYLDPDTEWDATYSDLKTKCKTEPQTNLLLLPLTERKDPSKLMFDGVRKQVSARQLLECGVVDKPTFNKLIKGEKTVPEVSLDKKISLKGTGSIAGVKVGFSEKISISEAKKRILMTPESADLLLEAQAATGHIIDPITNQKLTVEEACTQGVVDRSIRDKLLAAEAAAVGFKDPHTGKSLSVFEAMKKALIDKKTGVRLLQAQESAGGILDPNLSVFLPKDTAIKRNLLDEELCRALNLNPMNYIDPDTEQNAAYSDLKTKCKTEPQTNLLLLPLTEKKDPSKLMFDGVRKPVSAQQLLECGVLDKPTFNKLIKGEKTVPEVSEDKKIFLKGTGSIAGVKVGSSEKMSISEAKKQMLMTPESADMLLEAQAATGHIIDPITNQKLTVEEACSRGVFEKSIRDKLLAAESAAVGFKDPNTGKSLSVFEAMKKALIDKKTGVRLLQAQESAGGILDPNLSIFLPKETAKSRNLLDEELCRALSMNPKHYLDPDTERDATYNELKTKCESEPQTNLLLLPLTERKDPSKLMFDGVRKPVSARQLLECHVLDKPTFNKLIKGEKTVPEVSLDKKIFLKGSGSIAGVKVGSSEKMSISEAKKQMLMTPESADLLLEAQAATGHIIDPITNRKLTVDEACTRGVVDRSIRDKLLAAEFAAVGFKDPHTGKSLSVFEAMKKALIDKKTGVRLLQAQESAGGILDPNLSVFLPRDTAKMHNLLDEELCRALNQNPKHYLDPDTEQDATYSDLRTKCKTEPQTNLLLLPLTEKKDPSKLMFDGVRKPVSAQQLLECGVLDKPTFNKLIKGEKTVPEVSEDKTISLKGTGCIAGVKVGSSEKMSISEAKKQMLMTPECADLLLEAQAATGHIIDPITNQKLTVDEACTRGVVDRSIRDKLLAAESAAVGFKEPHTGKSLSVFEAMKKSLIDKKTGVRLLQAQESAGGILDPNLSVFLPRDTAKMRNLLDEELCRALNQNPKHYLDPDTERDATYNDLKTKCKTEPQTNLLLLPLTERKDPSKLMFDGVRKPVSAQQLLECGVLDKPTFNKLIKGEKTVPEVSLDKKISLKGTGCIAGVKVGSSEKMSISEAKKQMLMATESADLLLEAQAATGHIIDPITNRKLTVDEACTRGVVDRSIRDKLLTAESAAVGFKDPHTGKSLSVFEAMKKALIDKKTGVRLLQAQESAGGILDPNLSVFLPRDTAKMHNLLDEELCRALNQNPKHYLDPDTEQDATYSDLRTKCKTEPQTNLLLLPLTERKDPSKLMFDGVRKPVSGQQLLECGVLDKPTFNKLIKGEKTVPEVSLDKKIFLKGTGSIAGVKVGSSEKMSISEAKKRMLMSPESADLLLEAQAATGHIIDPITNQKLTVEEACSRGVVDRSIRDKLLAAESAAVGFKDPHTGKSLSVFEAMKKALIDKKTAVRLLQAQESVGGILDPNLSVFLPRETAKTRSLLDEELCHSLNLKPNHYIDPDTEQDATYSDLRTKCKTEPQTNLLLLPLTERKDPSKLMFDGVRKPVSAQQLLECGVLDKPTFNKLIKGEKTVPEISLDKKIFLKGTGSIAGVKVGSSEKMSISEAKKKMLMTSESAELLLEAQAATGHIIDPITNRKLTVDEACTRGVVDRSIRDKLLAAESAAVGFKDPHTGKSLSVFEAMKKALIDKKTGVRLLQAQESAGGILDPNLSVFLPRDTAKMRNLLDEEVCHALNQNPKHYLDPDTEQDATYSDLRTNCKPEPQTNLLLLPLTEKKDPSKLMFDGVRKPVSAQQLLECGVLDKPTFNKLIKGEKTVPEVSLDKMISLKGTGCIAGITVGSLGKMSISEAKKKMLMTPESADLLLEAQAATGYIIDPITNQKLRVDEACTRGVVDRSIRDKLLTAESAAVGFKDPHTGKSLSVFEAMKKSLIDKKTGVRLLQAQESAGGILDPNLSVFLPRDTAKMRNLLDEELCRALNQNPKHYIDPDTERDATYNDVKTKCKTDPKTNMLLLPLTEKKDPSKLMFDGVRKPVSAQQLLECGVLDKPTFNKLIKGEKTVTEVSLDKKIFLKGTGSIAGVKVGSSEKMSISEAKKQMLMTPESADLLLEAQAATGHIIDPITNQKLSVEEACSRGVVDRSIRDKLLAAESAAVGFKDPHTGKYLSVFEAMKKVLIDKKTGVRLLQAQESAGGIIDPNLSVFLPKDTAIKHNLLDEELCRALNLKQKHYLDPDTEQDATYSDLRTKCKTEPQTNLLLLPLTEKKDPSKLMFDGVRKPVSAQQLLECGVLDKPTFNKLIKGEKTVREVSVDKKLFLKGTGSIACVTVGSFGKMSILDAKKQMLMSPKSANFLLEAQAATGHIADIISNQKLTVEEACARGVLERSDREKLLAAEAAAVGYKDPHTGQSLSVCEAIKKGLTDKETVVRLLQAQESAGGILDPNLSIFLPRETALKRNLLDEDLVRALQQNPECYIDPETECGASYGSLKKKCTIEPQTGLMLLPFAEKKDPSKLMFDGLRKPVSALQLLECGVLDKPTFDMLIKGEKTVPDVSADKKLYLKGTESIAGITVGSLGKMSISEAKKKMLMTPESADLLLEAQAATGYIIDPITNQKLTVDEACTRGVVDRSIRDKLLTAESAAVGFKDPHTGKSLSVFEAMKKALIDKETGVRLLQAQESAGGILDPNLSIFLPIETALKRNLLDQDLVHALKQNPECYIDPETERGVSYESLKKKCPTEPRTGLMLLSLTEKKNPSKLMFDGLRKPVSAQQLLDCGVLDQSTFNMLIKGEKTIPEVSADKKVNLKGTGSIAGVSSSSQGNISFSEAKKLKIISEDSANLLLEAQAATGHIIDPKTEQKLTVEVACIRGVVDFKDQSRLLAAESAASGFKDPSSGKLMSLFEAMKKGLIGEKTGLNLLQAQDSVGGILDPNLSVFLPKDEALKRNLLDEKLIHALKQNPPCYLDPETECNVSYGALKAKCNTNTHTGLHILPVSGKLDPSKLVFDGVHKTVTAQQLLDCGVLDKQTFDKLMKGKRTVSEVSVDIKMFLKGTGLIAGVAAGPLGKMSFTEAKKQKIISSECANKLLLAQATTGHIIDPRTNKKHTVKEACAKELVDKEDESILFSAETATIGYQDPDTAKFLSVGQAMRKGIINKDTAVQLLQAQDSVGGILDPSVSVFLPKDIAMKRGLIDEDLYQALAKSPKCYLDPDTQQPTTYASLKTKCKSDPSTGLLLLPKPKQSTVRGLRYEVSVIDLVDAKLLSKSDVDQLNAGKLTTQDIEDRLRSYLGGSTSIAGVYDEASNKVLPIYQAMKNGLLRPGPTLELLEAQAASGFMIDPVNNLFLTVAEAYNRRLFGPEFKENLLAAEKAVTGYKMPITGEIISLFQAIENCLVEKGHGIHLLEAQIASGGIIDPQHSHRIDMNVAYQRGYFNEEMNKILTDDNDDTKGFFDPNTEENLTYLELKKRCISDKNTGLILLPIIDKKKQESSKKNTVRKRRVIIVDPETDKEMTVREAYNKGYIDYDTYLELSEQECEWEEITITAPDGSMRFVINDRSTGRQYDITDLLEKRVIDQSVVEQYRSQAITITQFADIISKQATHKSSSSSSSSLSSSVLSSNLIPEPSGRSSVTSSSLSSMLSTSRTSASLSSSSVTSSTSKTSVVPVPSITSSSSSSSSSTVVSRPLSPTFTKTTSTKTTTIAEKRSSSSIITEKCSGSLKQESHVSITLSPPLEPVGEVEPVGAVFDTEAVEKVSITEALNRGLVDSITAQRLLEAQACTGGIVNPTDGKRVSIQEASQMGLITNDMVTKLKPAQKAYFGFEDIKTKRKLSAALAIKEMWLPYEAGQRFLEFQVATGGLYDPEKGCRRSIEDALKMGWVDLRAAKKLQDVKNHTKNLTCPKSKLRISYKEVLDNCLVEEGTGVKILQASSVSSRGISSPYNIASAPGSKSGSRSGSQRGSRRSSLDLGSSLTKYNFTSFTSFSSTR
ncbi:epiplakin-like isoform X2 [Gambusia affinis]|uniref:epiplakin-like isoform X2 n=1 Tax=Gambusia affinis TaxID=33528 RepID=UPI001CDD5370|nr:epiplakin-like isoform X2 [Gambusia affinis]